MRRVTVNDPGKLILLILVTFSPILAKLAGVLPPSKAGELFELTAVATLSYLFGNGRVAVNAEKGGPGVPSPVLGPREPPVG